MENDRWTYKHITHRVRWTPVFKTMPSPTVFRPRLLVGSFANSSRTSCRFSGKGIARVVAPLPRSPYCFHRRTIVDSLLTMSQTKLVEQKYATHLISRPCSLRSISLISSFLTMLPRSYSRIHFSTLGSSRFATVEQLITSKIRIRKRHTTVFVLVYTSGVVVRRS